MFSDIFSGELGGPFWWLALAIAGVSAALHLATMLGTHWGDHGVLLKALAFSLLAHVMLICGLLAIGPQIESFVAGKPQEHPENQEPIPIQIRKLLTEADRPHPGRQPGNVSVWNQPSNAMASTVDRSERDVKLDPFAEPTRQAEPPASLPSQLPAAESLADLPAPQGPQKIDLPVEPFQPRTAATPNLSDEAPAEARSDQMPSLARRTREGSFAPGEAEEIDRVVPEQQAPRTPGMAPLPTLADLKPDGTPAKLPKTSAPFAGMTLRRPKHPPKLPESMLGDEENQAGGSAGQSVRSTPIGRRAPATSSSRMAAPSTRRRTIQPEPEGPTGAGPSLASPSSVAPLDPQGGKMPALARIGLGSPIGPANTVPEVYRLRSLDRRSEIARKNGGTKASEQAVERSLAWLAASQTRFGYWDASAFSSGLVGINEEGVDRNHAGRTADAGVTALAILAFLGAGYTHESGKYSETVSKALGWLIEHQRDDGFLGGNARHFEQMYCHGMATYAMAEAYGMESDDGESELKLRRPLIDAIIYIITQQGTDGGWRYVKGQPGDMSMFGWQCMALKSADIAGIPMSRNVRKKMIAFLKKRSLGEQGGLAGYREGLPATPPMTAEALFCKQMLGIHRAHPASAEAVAYLLEHLPRRSQLNYYYWYYGTLAMFQYGGEPWKRWNNALRDLLIAEQIRNGKYAGSWAPKDVWGRYGGRIYSTAVATLCLEVYYRFLPLYRDGGQ